jgi:hypothetical protein
VGTAVGNVVGARVGCVVHDAHAPSAHARPPLQPHCFAVHAALAQKQLP